VSARRGIDRHQHSALVEVESGRASGLDAPDTPDAAEAGAGAGAGPSEGAGIFGLSHSPRDAKVILIPVPFEATTSHGGGTSDGPGAILHASRQIDLVDLETSQLEPGKPSEQGIAMLDESPDLRAWDLSARMAASHVLARGGTHGEPALLGAAASADALIEKMNAQVRSTAALFLGRGKIVGTVGGDHSVSFGAIEAHAARYPGLGVLHFGAHADLRRAHQGFTWSHASILDNVLSRLPGVARLVQVGVRDLCAEEHERIAQSEGRIVTFFDAQLAEARFAGETWAQQCARILATLPAQVYLSFVIDALDPALCPHTGRRVPGGLSFQMATYLIAAVVRSGRRLVGFDLTEVAPAADGGDWDQAVGARILYKLCGWAVRSLDLPCAAP